MSDRFFFEGPLSPGPVTLEGAEAHHLSAVRRFVPGDLIVLFNGDGHEYPARISALAKKHVSLEITGVESPSRERGFGVHLAAALPKGDRGDFLIEKLTELGVTEFTPLITERTVVKADGTKTEKIRRAVIEASKQCGRNVLMRIHETARWMDWCVKQTGDRLIAVPGATGDLDEPRAGVTIAVGPEGGFTANEVKIAVEAGWMPMSLGPRVLRVETAAIVAVARMGRG